VPARPGEVAKRIGENGSRAAAELGADSPGLYSAKSAVETGGTAVAGKGDVAGMERDATEEDADDDDDVDDVDGVDVDGAADVGGNEATDVC